MKNIKMKIEDIKVNQQIVLKPFEGIIANLNSLGIPISTMGSYEWEKYCKGIVTISEVVLNLPRFYIKEDGGKAVWFVEDIDVDRTMAIINKNKLKLI